MRYGFIYETTNLVTGMKYIGQHRREQDPHDPDDSWYLGSGKYFTNALHKYGVENFSRTILEEVDSEEELNAREEYYLELYRCASNPIYYNMTNSSYRGGTKGYHHTDESKALIGSKSGATRTGMRLSDSHRAHISEALNSPENRKRQRDMMTGTMKVHDGVNERSISPDELEYYESLGYKRGRSPLAVEKIARGNIGKSRPHTENQAKALLAATLGTILVSKDSVAKRVRPEEVDSYLSDGWIKGMSQEFSEKRSKDVSGKVHVYRGEDQKFVYSNEVDSYLSDGWSRGLPPSQRAKMSKAAKEREKNKYRWIHKGEKQMRVKEVELQAYLDEGYELGMNK